MQPLDAALLEMVDYLIVNETEAAQLSGIDVRDATSARLAATRLLALGAGAVLLTMGGQGVFVAEVGDSGRMIPAVPVTVVDTTAAGDTFVGAFAVGLGQGLNVVEAATAAQYAAALTVTQLGAQSSIPSRAQVEKFIADKNMANRSGAHAA